MKPKKMLLRSKSFAALLISAAIFAGCSKNDAGVLPPDENEIPSQTATTTDETSGTTSAMATRQGLLLDAGFEGSTPFAGMSTVQTATSYGITASTAQYNEGSKSFKSTVLKTDPSISSGYRSEITFPGISDQGEMWYGYSTYFESIPLGGGHVIQWHPNNSNGSATLSLWTGDGKFMVVRNPSGTNINYYQPNPQAIVARKWYDIVWHVKWSSSSTGLIEMWIDGVKYFSYTGVTAQTGVYLKLGQNLWVRNNDGIIYYDNLRIGGSNASYADVAPEGGTSTSTPPTSTTTPTAPVGQPPVVKPGADQTITLPTNSVSLDGSSSSDPDGSISSFLWTKDFGTGGTISSPNAAKSTVTGLTAGVYRFRLKVTDNQGNSASDTVRITVKAAVNQAPIVSAGANQTVTLPTTRATLRGTASDPDGSIASYKWRKVSGPSGGGTSATTASATVKNLRVGTYVYELKVTDNKGATATSNTSVIVISAPVTSTPPPTTTTPSTGTGSYGTQTFATGYDVASDVNTNQGPRNSVSFSIKKSGAGSFRSEVRSSDPSTSSGYRGEMQYNGSAYNPTEGVVEYDVYYENWRNFGGGGHSMQWHPDNGNGSAALSLYTYDGKFMVVRNLGSKYDGANYYQSGNLMTIAPNKWYNMRWEFKWATSGGYIRLYIDGQLYYSYSGETMNSTTGMPYMKVGQNRWSMPSGTNTVVYYDNLKVFTK